MIATVVLLLRLALAIALYTFLGWALLTLWRELKGQGQTLAGLKKPGIVLTIHPGQDREIQKHILQTEIIIGRHANCDVALIDDAMSAQHGRIAFHHGQWWLEDLDSTNGTFLNGAKLNTPAVVITGDEFKCGNSLFKIQIDHAEKTSFDKS